MVVHAADVIKTTLAGATKVSRPSADRTSHEVGKAIRWRRCMTRSRLKCPNPTQVRCRWETCIDIVAFLLQSNGMPSGLTELTTDIEALDRIHLTATAPAP